MPIFEAVSIVISCYCLYNNNLKIQPEDEEENRKGSSFSRTKLVVLLVGNRPSRWRTTVERRWSVGAETKPTRGFVAYEARIMMVVVVSSPGFRFGRDQREK